MRTSCRTTLDRTGDHGNAAIDRAVSSKTGDREDTSGCEVVTFSDMGSARLFSRAKGLGAFAQAARQPLHIHRQRGLETQPVTASRVDKAEDRRVQSLPPEGDERFAGRGR